MAIKIKQQIKPTTISGSNTILIQVIKQKTKPRIGTTGNKGAAKPSSALLCPCLYHSRLKLNWLRQILIHTTTMVKAATPSRFLKIVSGAKCSDSKPGNAPNIVTITAI